MRRPHTADQALRKGQIFYLLWRNKLTKVMVVEPVSENPKFSELVGVKLVGAQVRFREERKNLLTLQTARKLQPVEALMA